MNVDSRIKYLGYHETNLDELTTDLTFVDFKMAGSLIFAGVLVSLGFLSGVEENGLETTTDSSTQSFIR